MSDAHQKKVDYDHECPEWDYMFIKVQDLEFQFCNCYIYDESIYEE